MLQSNLIESYLTNSYANEVEVGELVKRIQILPQEDWEKVPPCVL